MSKLVKKQMAFFFFSSMQPLAAWFISFTIVFFVFFFFFFIIQNLQFILELTLHVVHFMDLQKCTVTYMQKQQHIITLANLDM